MVPWGFALIHRILPYVRQFQLCVTVEQNAMTPSATIDDKINAASAMIWSMPVPDRERFCRSFTV